MRCRRFDACRPVDGTAWLAAPAHTTGHGRLIVPYSDSVSIMRASRRDLLVVALTVALAWVLHRLGDLGLAVIGATKPWQARAAASAMALSLGDDEMGLLTERSDHALK